MSCRCRCSRPRTAKQRVAAQSELLALDETLFLLLCRDAGNGYGTDGATSRYRSIELRRYLAGDQYRGLALRRHRAGRARWQAGGGDRAGDADPLHRHQRQCGTEQVRLAQRRAERPQQSVGEVGRHDAGAGTRSRQSERFLLVHHQRQRLHHAERLSGRRRLIRMRAGSKSTPCCWSTASRCRSARNSSRPARPTRRPVLARGAAAAALHDCCTAQAGCGTTSRPRDGNSGHCARLAG